MVIVVGGSRRKAGKTTLIESLIRENEEAGWTAIKVTPHRHTTGIGDTERYLAAGAVRALLLHHEDLPRIGEYVAKARNVIVESNSALDYIQPDVCIFVVDHGETKPSFARHIGKADVIFAVRRTQSRTWFDREFSSESAA